jgi:hypothetical protein
MKLDFFEQVRILIREYNNDVQRHAQGDNGYEIHERKIAYNEKLDRLIRQFYDFDL